MPVREFRYQSGFANEFATEAIEGALPQGRNSPQKPALGLYAEQISGTSFTAPRALNRRSWLYRIHPSVIHGNFQPINPLNWRTSPFDEASASPNQLRWDPLPLPDEPEDFISGMVTMAANGDARAGFGIGVHIYRATASMGRRFFSCSDGELLIVPQQGSLQLDSEMGSLGVEPGEVAVIPRGVKFRVELPDRTARGYVCENYGSIFRLPELGLIGANGLANSRDFQTPVAAYEDSSGDFELIVKMQGVFWSASLAHSPLDVVAWHGNYAPYKYDLRKYNVINSVSFDHPDPSIFTVLTSTSDTAGVANCDFVIFPPRWLVAEATFRPPYFHRNVMSEFMGLILGQYDAKPEGFVPGGSSLHNSMSAHGPDTLAFQRASEGDLEPQYLGDTLAFMFESRYVLAPTRFAMESPQLQKSYRDCWQDLPKLFSR